MTAVAAPVIQSEMSDWVALGGGNSGIVGDQNHDYGFHVAANLLPSSDYSRWRDPNGSDGPYVDWDYCCAGDFSHKNDPRLREMHVDVLSDLMDGKYPMICEFIGKPWPDRPVYYWARWNGIETLQKYTGQGHDHWSHISWYRSRADERANLWTGGDMPETEEIVNGVWHMDGKPAIANKYYPWRTDSPAHTPPGSNEWITGGTAIVEAAQRGNKAYETAEALKAEVATLAVKVEEILQILRTGLPIPGEVVLAPVSVQAVADATADEIRNDPERNG